MGQLLSLGGVNGALNDASAALQTETMCPHTKRAIRRANEIDAKAKRSRFLRCLDTHDHEIGRVYPSYEPLSGGVSQSIVLTFADWAGVRPEEVTTEETKDGDRIVIDGEIVGRTEWGTL